MKWQDYKETKTTIDGRHFYSMREHCVSDLFNGMKKMPIFYDGTINSKQTKDAQAYLLEKDNIQYIVFRNKKRKRFNLELNLSQLVDTINKPFLQ
jgi:predicted transport protein